MCRAKDHLTKKTRFIEFAHIYNIDEPEDVVTE
jgi:hypothetical protein